MGQKITNQKKAVAQIFKNKHGMSFLDALEQASVNCLLEIGNQISSTDYSVRHYTNPKHPQFYQKREKLLTAIRYSYSIGAFDHREQAQTIIQRYM